MSIPSGTDPDLSIRRAHADDADRIGRFLRGMPERDLLFFRQNIEDEKVVAAMVSDTPERAVISMLAERDGNLVGMAYVQRRNVPWLRHVGDVVAIVLPAMRGEGLGTRLLRETILAAQPLALEKVVAHIVIEDRDSVRVFEKLGFRHEGILLDHAKSNDGTLFDLALMGLDLKRHRARLAGADAQRPDLTKR